MSARSAGQEVCRRRGSCRSSRRGRAVPRHVRRQGRGGEARVSLLCMSLLCASACLSAWGLLRTGFACACVPRVCVSVWAGFVAVRVVCRVLRPLRTPGRPRAGAVTHSAQHARHALHAQLRLRLRGERGRRVCRTSCVRVWSHAVQRVFC